jgi:hypothetical protein
MTDLAPVLTGCHVCRSPLVDLINARIKRGMADTAISKWLESEGHYVSRITLGKHKRDHLTSDHEAKRIAAAESLQKQSKTIKFNGDLASLVRDQVVSLVEGGTLMPSLAEGLRAQEIIDRRQEKSSDRELAIALAGILGGSIVVDGTATEIEGPTDTLVQVLEATVQAQVEPVDDGARLEQLG